MTPTEKVRRVRAGIAGLKRMRRFVDYRESFALARKLEALLGDLNLAADDPRTGVELVAAFYETDEKVLGNCDDSSGSVGDIYRIAAADLFVRYATACEEKRRLADLLWRLIGKDDYGVRDVLLDRAVAYLPEELLRELIFRAWSEARKEEDEFRARRRYMFVESLARQLKDPATYEKARRASWPKLGPAACYDIAEVYLEAGDTGTALSWVNRVPKGEAFQADRRDDLLLALYTKTGEQSERDTVARRIFRGSRSGEALDELIAILGEARRAEVIHEESRLIAGAEELSIGDAFFLVECGLLDEAASYLLDRADQLDGEYYAGVLPLCKVMEKDERFLVASLIYRALLDSILARGISKHYTHGVRYLRKLDALAPKVEDWKRFAPHDVYAAALRKDHARKSAFWKRYAS
ncbi:MAG: DUF6880 family protein [Candidatus Eisenbacteria bacterium]